MPASRPAGSLKVLQSKADEMLALANGVRAAQGLRPLEWDPSLAYAALQHCLRMVANGSIAHQYEGEAELSARLGDAGASFSAVAENIGQGPQAGAIHQAWMDSPGHRANLLNPEMDHVGIAVVAVGDMLYAVSDFSRTQAAMTQPQVEVKFADLLRARGMEITKDPKDARDFCNQPDDSKGFNGNTEPLFVVRWQSSDTSQLPQLIVDRAASGKYHAVSVGSCPAQNAQGQLSVFRVAILFY